MSKGSTKSGNGSGKGSSSGKGGSHGRAEGAGKQAGKSASKTQHKTRLSPGVQAFTGKDSKGKPVTVLVKPRGPIPVGHVKKDWTKSGTSLIKIKRADRLPVEATPLAGGTAAKAGLDTRGKVVKALKAAGMTQPTAQAQLRKGVKVEMEHTRSKRVAQHIAADHLAEIPDYYSRLEKMEKTGQATPQAKALASTVNATPQQRAAALAGNQTAQEQLAKRIGATIGRLDKIAGKIGGTRPAHAIGKLKTLQNQWAAATSVQDQAKIVDEIKATLHGAQSLERGLQKKELDWAKSQLKTISTQLEYRRSSTDPSYRNLGISTYTMMESEKAALEQHVKVLEAGKLQPRPDLAAAHAAGAALGAQRMSEMMQASADAALRIEGRKMGMVIKKEDALEAAKRVYNRTSAHANTAGKASMKPAHEAVVAAEARVKDAFQYNKPVAEKRAAIQGLQAATEAAQRAADRADLIKRLAKPQTPDRLKQIEQKKAAKTVQHQRSMVAEGNKILEEIAKQEAALLPARKRGESDGAYEDRVYKEKKMLGPSQQNLTAHEKAAVLAALEDKASKRDAEKNRPATWAEGERAMAQHAMGMMNKAPANKALARPQTNARLQQIGEIRAKQADLSRNAKDAFFTIRKVYQPMYYRVVFEARDGKTYNVDNWDEAREHIQPGVMGSKKLTLEQLVAIGGVLHVRPVEGGEGPAVVGGLHVRHPGLPVMSIVVRDGNQIVIPSPTSFKSAAEKKDWEYKRTAKIVEADYKLGSMHEAQKTAELKASRSAKRKATTSRKEQKPPEQITETMVKSAIARDAKPASKVKAERSKEERELDNIQHGNEGDGMKAALNRVVASGVTNPTVAQVRAEFRTKDLEHAMNRLGKQGTLVKGVSPAPAAKPTEVVLRDYHGGAIAEGGAAGKKGSVTATIRTQSKHDRVRQEMKVFSNAKKAEAWIDRQAKKDSFIPWDVEKQQPVTQNAKEGLSYESVVARGRHFFNSEFKESGNKDAPGLFDDGRQIAILKSSDVDVWNERLHLEHYKGADEKLFVGGDGRFWVKLNESYVPKTQLDKAKDVLGPGVSIKAAPSGNKPIVMEKDGTKILIAPLVDESSTEKFVSVDSAMFAKASSAIHNMKKEDLGRLAQISNFKDWTKEGLIGEIFHANKGNELVAKYSDIIEKKSGAPVGKLKALPKDKPGVLAPSFKAAFETQLDSIVNNREYSQRARDSILHFTKEKVDDRGQVSALLDKNTAILRSVAIAKNRRADLEKLLVAVQEKKGGRGSELESTVKTRIEKESDYISKLEDSEIYKQQMRTLHDIELDVESWGYSNTRGYGNREDIIKAAYLGKDVFNEQRKMLDEIRVKQGVLEPKLNRIHRWAGKYDRNDDFNEMTDETTWRSATQRFRGAEALKSALEKALLNGEVNQAKVIAKQYEKYVLETNAMLDKTMADRIKDFSYSQKIEREFDRRIKENQETIAGLTSKIDKEKSRLDTKSHGEGTKAAQNAEKHNAKTNENIRSLEYEKERAESRIQDILSNRGKVLIEHQAPHESASIKNEIREKEAAIDQARSEYARYNTERTSYRSFETERELYSHVLAAEKELTRYLAEIGSKNVKEASA